MAPAQRGSHPISRLTTVICLLTVFSSFGLLKAQEPNPTRASTSARDPEPQDLFAQAAQAMVTARGNRTSNEDLQYLLESIEKPSPMIRTFQNSWAKALKESTGDDPVRDDLFRLLLTLRTLGESEDILRAAALLFESRIKKLPKSMTDDWKAAAEKASGATVSLTSAATVLVQYEALFDKDTVKPQRFHQYLSRVQSVPEDARDQWAQITSFTKRSAVENLVKVDALFENERFLADVFARALPQAKDLLAKVDEESDSEPRIVSATPQPPQPIATPQKETVGPPGIVLDVQFTFSDDREWDRGMIEIQAMQFILDELAPLEPPKKESQPESIDRNANFTIAISRDYFSRASKSLDTSKQRNVKELKQVYQSFVDQGKFNREEHIATLSRLNWGETTNFLTGQRETFTWHNQNPDLAAIFARKNVTVENDRIPGQFARVRIAFTATRKDGYRIVGGRASGIARDAIGLDATIQITNPKAETYTENIQCEWPATLDFVYTPTTDTKTRVAKRLLQILESTSSAQSKPATDNPAPQTSKTKVTSEKKPVILVVRLPLDGKLELEGEQTATKGDVRQFQIPPVPTDADSRYRLKASWKEESDQRTVTRTLLIRGGQRVEIDLRKPQDWPQYSGELAGSQEVRVKNPNAFKVTVGLRSDGKGKDFTVKANDTQSVSVSNGHYDIYFQYSTDPDGLYQGDNFTLNNNGVEIQIVKVVNGNYGIKKIK